MERSKTITVELRLDATQALVEIERIKAALSECQRELDGSLPPPADEREAMEAARRKWASLKFHNPNGASYDEDEAFENGFAAGVEYERGRKAAGVTNQQFAPTETGSSTTQSSSGFSGHPGEPPPPPAPDHAMKVPGRIKIKDSPTLATLRAHSDLKWYAVKSRRTGQLGYEHDPVNHDHFEVIGPVNLQTGYVEPAATATATK